RDGKRTLFVEIDQPEEVERALELAREHGIAKMVFEVAANAAGAVEAIADAGIPVIVLGAEPLPLPPSAAFGDTPTAPIAVALADHGVPIAIGSAAVARARHLPQIAGEAVGAGVAADRALRAITRDAAAILGVGDHCGSLEAGKLADVLLTTAPLFAPECRILRVYSRGEIAHAAR
ncbi:MAG: amidohydrolase family protein, partial [Planctomycetota bacterium]